MVKENAPDNSQIETRQQMIERLGEKNKAYSVMSEGFDSDNEQLFPKKKVSFKIEPGKYFSKALTEAMYGEGKDFSKDITSAQRNVILNIDLMILHHGINTNVVKIGDEWNFDFENGTFEATLGGKDVKGQLNLPERVQVIERTTEELREEYAKTESGHSLADMLSDDEVQSIDRADQRLAEHRADQASRARLSTAERLDTSRVTSDARREIFGDDTTVMETAIESGSLEAVMEALQQLTLSFKQRKALIQSDELFVDDLITGMNHYLPADKAMESDGSNYTGTAEQNIAWTKVVEDILKPGLPEYLESGVEIAPETEAEPDDKEKINIIGLYEYANILERDWSKFLERDFGFANVDVSTTVNEEAGTVSYTVALTDKDGNPQVFGGVIRHTDEGNIEDQYRFFLDARKDFFDKYRGGSEAPVDERTDLEKAMDAVPVGLQPDGRERVDQMTRSGSDEGAASIGEIQGVGGGKSGKLEGPAHAELTEPELPPVEKLERTYDAEAEEEARIEGDCERSKASLEPVEDRDLTPEPLLGEPGAADIVRDAEQLGDMGEYSRIPAETPEERARRVAKRAEATPEIAEEVTAPVEEVPAGPSPREERIAARTRRAEERQEIRDTRAQEREAARLEREAAQESARASEQAPLKPGVFDQLEVLGADKENPRKGFDYQSTHFEYVRSEDGNLVYDGKTAQGYPVVLTLNGGTYRAEFYNSDSEGNVTDGVSEIADIRPVMAAVEYASTRMEKAYIDPRTLGVSRKAERMEARKEKVAGKESRKRLRKLGANPKNPEEGFKLGELDMEYFGQTDEIITYDVAGSPSLLRVVVNLGETGGVAPYKVLYLDTSNEVAKNASKEFDDVDELMRFMHYTRKVQMLRE